MSRLAYEEWAAAHRERDYMTTYRLIYAIDNNHEEAKKLLESGAEINVVPPILDDPTDYYHYTSTPDPLMDFILRSHYIPGHSPLHHAAATGNARAATLLLQHGGWQQSCPAQQSCEPQPPRLHRSNAPPCSRAAQPPGTHAAPHRPRRRRIRQGLRRLDPRRLPPPLP